MKVFISWSGDRSKQVAELLSTWVQCVLQAVDPWLSSKDIDRGSLWFSEITNQLANTQNGIVCLTKSNLNKPWILFEAGALAKGLTSNRVFTFLIDLNSSEVKDPLAQFNHTAPTKDGLYQLVRTINNSLDSLSLKENILANVFETYWPQFEKEFKEILKNTKEEEVVEQRPKDDILYEILYSVRTIEKRVRVIEEKEALRIIDTNTIRRLKVAPNPLLTPIEEFDFSVRTFNVLKKLGINSLQDFMKLDLDTIKSISDSVKDEVKQMIDKIS